MSKQLRAATLALFASTAAWSLMTVTAEVSVPDVLASPQKGGGGKPAPPPPNAGVTAAFDNTYSGLFGDGWSYSGAPSDAAAPTHGAFFMTIKSTNNQDFDLLLDRTSFPDAPGDVVRSILLNLGPPETPGTCAPRIPCRMPSDWTSSTLQIWETWGPYGLRVRPIQSDGTYLPGGMEAMTDEPMGAYVGFNFEAEDDTGKLMVWKISFDYTQVQVTRLGNTWTIDGSDAVAHLEASPDGSSRNRTDEGYFSVPFGIVVTKK